MTEWSWRHELNELFQLFVMKVGWKANFKSGIEEMKPDTCIAKLTSDAAAFFQGTRCSTKGNTLRKLTLAGQHDFCAGEGDGARDKQEISVVFRKELRTGP